MNIIEEIAKVCEDIDAVRNAEFTAAPDIQTTEEKILEGGGDPAPAPAESAESEVE